MSLERKCWDAFENEDHKEAVRLLALVKELNKIKRRYSVWDNVSLLHLSSRYGWLDVTKGLITKYHCDPHERNDDGWTCLHYAAWRNHVDVMRYLIDEGHCDPMAVNGEGCTPLHYAASWEGNHVDVMRYLIDECHCDPMAVNRWGWTPLHYAAEDNHVDVMRYLIDECDCDPMAVDSRGWTPLHYAAGGNQVDVMRYLIDECHCDPMTVNGTGGTPLHVATSCGSSAAVGYLLSTSKCDPLAKDNEGRTPFKLAKERGHTDTLSVLKKFGDIKSSHPIDSYVNVLLVGNPGAGKSTLSHVINDTATGSIVLGSFRNVGGVVPCTAGIIPYKLQHRTLGNIILHDFAGHSEYYSSHSAVIENLLQGSGGVFLIVVNILEKEPVKQLHQWLTVVRNEAHKALNQCHVIVIVSHKDEISNPVERRRRKEEIQEIIVRERYDSVFLDCRKLGGSGVDSFFNKLCSACESIRSTSGRNLSLYCHMMYGLLEERKENILTLSDVMSAGKDNDDYFIPDKRENVLDVLHSLHSTGLISVLKIEDKKEEFLVNATGTRRTGLKEILADESLSDISNLSLLGGQDIKEVIEITEEFKTPLTPIKLDIKKLGDVIKVLTSDQHLPCSVWRRLGLQLGLYDPRLVDIDTDCRGKTVECFHECMSTWLRGEDGVREKGGPSWSSLATALDTIDQKSISSYIRDKYC
uniref:Uncharacterized protein n=1 Tax=Amphimedon queenslandica TaxID=400682 RepID=A0A1X7TRT2_AMPQE